jgi:dTDP-4-dehydrorhamnose 3,5-epimerase
VIEGVSVHPLVSHVDARGSLTELLRSDWPEFVGFGQALLTVNLPGVIRAWHWHARQTDAIIVVSGEVKVGLYDARDGSTTGGTVEEHVATGSDPVVIFVPPGVWHGYKTIGPVPAMILNCPDRVYDHADPDEGRAAHDAKEVPYIW